MGLNIQPMSIFAMSIIIDYLLMQDGMRRVMGGNASFWWKEIQFLCDVLNSFSDHRTRNAIIWQRMQ